MIVVFRFLGLYGSHVYLLSRVVTELPFLILSTLVFLSITMPLTGLQFHGIKLLILLLDLLLLQLNAHAYVYAFSFVLLLLLQFLLLFFLMTILIFYYKNIIIIIHSGIYAIKCDIFSISLLLRRF
jgi:hypothetical protein